MTPFARELRRGGWSLRHFGETIGVTEAAVSLWASGKRTPSLAYIPRIAKALEITIEDVCAIFGCRDTG